MVYVLRSAVQAVLEHSSCALLACALVLAGCGGDGEGTAGADGLALEGPQQVQVGAPFDVTWSDPDTMGIFVAIAEQGTGDERGFYDYDHAQRVREGNPLALRAPERPGTYELRYVATDDSTHVLLRTPLTVNDASASLTLPSPLMTATPVELAWTGPGNPGDFIGIAEQGTPTDMGYYDYDLANKVGDAATISLTTPATPGPYEVRYVMDQTNRVLAREAVTIEPARATLDAPTEAAPGAQLSVGWVGPNGPNDFVAVARPDAPAGSYESRALTRAGSPASVFAPGTAGAYEVRYVWAVKDSILHAQPLAVTPDAAPDTTTAE
jgi:Ca-activated chloride channel family protein